MSNTMSARGVDDAVAGRLDWGWWVALGVLLVIAGAIALTNIALATVASVLVVGAMMIVGGTAQIIFAFSVRRRWGRFLLWLILGIAYLAAGILAWRNPALAASALTLVLASALVVTGIFRIAAGIGLRPMDGWGWVVASGVLTLILGFMIGLGWPVNTLWVLGLFLGIDLLFAGVAYIVFGLALRPRPQR